MKKKHFKNFIYRIALFSADSHHGFTLNKESNAEVKTGISYKFNLDAF